ncbi:MAG TPA: sugar ABC transporter permease [Methylomirabilota bacterium]|nr:sugar ABC transporter permease [Methylomirabilota bacterium]
MEILDQTRLVGRRTTGGRRSIIRPRLAYRLQLGLMLAPYLIGLVLLIVLPAAIGLPLAFFDYDAIRPAEWVGLDNFRALWRDPIFRKSIESTAIFVAMAVPARLIGALLLALLLVRPFRGSGAYRATAYLPTVVPDIAWAIVWLWILNPLYGPINLLLGSVGLPQPAWMLEERSAQVAIVVMLSWQIGEAFVVLLAALGDVPDEVLEQSSVDGASVIQTFFRVTLPLLAPVLLIVMLEDTVRLMTSSFVPAQIVGRDGGPNYATTFLPFYAYVEAFSYLRFGYAAAATWVLYGLTAGVLLLQYRLAVRWRLGFRDAD